MNAAVKRNHFRHESKKNKRLAKKNVEKNTQMHQYREGEKRTGKKFSPITFRSDAFRYFFSVCLYYVYEPIKIRIFRKITRPSSENELFSQKQTPSKNTPFGHFGNKIF